MHHPSTLHEVREVTEAFLSPSNDQRPLKAASLWQCPSSCGLSGFAHVTSTRHPRVDPDAWLATLDQKMYLRRVGRDGCVEVDLATY